MQPIRTLVLSGGGGRGARVRLAFPQGYRLMDEPLAAAASNAEASGGSFEVVGSMDEEGEALEPQ